MKKLIYGLISFMLLGFYSSNVWAGGDSCWNAPSWCVQVVGTKFRDGYFTVKYKNTCDKRIYIKYCNGRTNGSSDCGSTGIRPGRTSTWSTGNATGNYAYNFIGIENPNEDWTCRKPSGWHNLGG